MGTPGKAIILAGGRGTRLGELARDIPKPMVQLAGKPILEHIIELLRFNDIRDVLLTVGYKAEVIQNHFKNGERFGVRISYFKEETPLGTAGAVPLCAEFIGKEPFYLVYGDIYMNCDLRRMAAFHEAHQAMATLAVHPNDHPHDSDLVEVNANWQISRFCPKPHAPGYYRNLVNAALYILDPQALDQIPRDRPSDFGKDVFPEMLKAGKPLYAYRTSEYMKDVGTPDRLTRVEKDIRSGVVELKNMRNKQPAVFLDRDGVLVEDHAYIKTPDELNLLPGADEALRLLNRSQYLAVLTTNQPVVARGECTIEQLETIHHKLETELGARKSWLDAIYFCPHHPDKGFPGENPQFKTHCECRKPKPGMIQAATKELNVDLSKSFMIGDSFRDIACGAKAGVATIGVRTGKGCRDYPQGDPILPSPDFMFKDVAEACRFIVQDPLASHAANILSRLQGSHSPIVVIGGSSHSGKSTLAAYLALQYRRNGTNPVTVHLDDWILPLKMRKPGSTVFDRYQLSTLDKDMARLLSGETLQHRPYNRQTRDQADRLISYHFNGTTPVIIEGVVALAVPELLKKASLKVFCKGNRALQIERFFEHWEWRKNPRREAESALRERAYPEWEEIDKTEIHADIVVSEGANQ